MMKFLLNILQITIITRVGYSTFKWMLRGTKRRKKNIINKITKLISNKMHHKLDNALRKQKEIISSPKIEKIELPSNVIPFKKIR